MKAYTVSFQAKPTGRGRHHKGGAYETAIVIADSAVDATSKAEKYRAKNFPKLVLEEIRFEDARVIQ